MTGELFSLLKAHSILADLLQGEVEANEAFKQAAKHALDEEALTADLFAVRAGVLLGQAKKEDAATWTSGLLIGSDVRIGLSVPDGAQIHVMGRPELTRLYAAASVRPAGRLSNSTVNNVSSPAFMRSRRGFPIEPQRAVPALSLRMPADRNHPRCEIR